MYRRFKCRNTFVQKFNYTDKIYFNPLCLYLISWRENQSGIPDCYWCFWLNFPRAVELHLVKWRTYFSLISPGYKSLLYFKLFFENMSVSKKLMVHHHRFFKSWINIFAATLTTLFSWMQLQLDQLVYTNRKIYFSYSSCFSNPTNKLFSSLLNYLLLINNVRL